MREFSVNKITNELKSMCMQANYVLSADVKAKLETQSQAEVSPIGESILKDIVKKCRYCGEKFSANVPGYRNGRCVFRDWTRCPPR